MCIVTPPSERFKWAPFLVQLMKMHLHPPSEALSSDNLAHVLCHFPLTGLCVAKPEMIFKLERGEELWILEEESSGRGYPGECAITRHRETGAIRAQKFRSEYFGQCSSVISFLEALAL